MLTVTGASVTSIKNGATTTNPTNYTVVGDTVTIKKGYLATLTDGEKTFNLYTKTTVVSVVITVQTTA